MNEFMLEFLFFMCAVCGLLLTEMYLLLLKILKIIFQEITYIKKGDNNA